MRILSVLVVLFAICFQSRPGKDQLQRFFKGYDQQNLVDVLLERGLEPAWKVSSKSIWDFKVCTLAYPSRSPRVRYFGVLGQFVEYQDKDDIVVIMFLYMVSYLLGYFYKNWWYEHCSIRASRPTSFITNSFFISNIFELGVVITAFANDAEYLYWKSDRKEFLFAYMSVVLLSAITELASTHYPTPSGSLPVVVCLLVYSVLLDPIRLHSFWGLDVAGVNAIVVHFSVMAFLSRASGSFFSRYATGACSGVVSFFYFHGETADAFFEYYSIPLGHEKDSYSLLAPLLGCNILFAKMIR